MAVGSDIAQLPRRLFWGCQVDNGCAVISIRNESPVHTECYSLETNYLPIILINKLLRKLSDLFAHFWEDLVNFLCGIFKILYNQRLRKKWPM